ncbi:MAG: response regulator [Proteobacteria bacterium]|nr:response regulator [Pseudomonadota bacterium]
MFQKPYSLVILDDDQDVSDVLADYIHELFPDVFKIQTFDDPKLALKFIETNSVRLVFTDVRMPGLTGDQVNLQIKQMGQGIKTIIITGIISREQALNYYNQGVDAFVQKPFIPKEVQATIQRILDNIAAWEDVLYKIIPSKVS